MKPFKPCNHEMIRIFWCTSTHGQLQLVLAPPEIVGQNEVERSNTLSMVYKGQREIGLVMAPYFFP